jgi:urea transporter
MRHLPLALVLTTVAAAQQAISFPTADAASICADLYGHATRAVVLAHGGQFKKESWRVQANALVRTKLTRLMRMTYSLRFAT